MMARRRPALGLGDRAIVVANPLPEAEQVDPALHDRVLADALAAAAAQGVRGGATTPFLLDRFHRETGGATLEANVALVRRNAVLAARIARAAAGMSGSSSRATSWPTSSWRSPGPVAHGSDTPARIAQRGGGAGANLAVWLARAGARRAR